MCNWDGSDAEALIMYVADVLNPFTRCELAQIQLQKCVGKQRLKCPHCSGKHS